MKSIDSVLYIDRVYNDPRILVAGSGDFATYAYRKEDGSIGYGGPSISMIEIRLEDQNEEQRRLVRGLEGKRISKNRPYVTEPMVSAALEVLSKYGLRDPASPAERLTVREVLESALARQPIRKIITKQ